MIDRFPAVTQMTRGIRFIIWIINFVESANFIFASFHMNEIKKRRLRLQHQWFLRNRLSMYITISGLLKITTLSYTPLQCTVQAYYVNTIPLQSTLDTNSSLMLPNSTNRHAMSVFKPFISTYSGFMGEYNRMQKTHNKDCSKHTIRTK